MGGCRGKGACRAARVAPNGLLRPPPRPPLAPPPPPLAAAPLKRDSFSPRVQHACRTFERFGLAFGVTRVFVVTVVVWFGWVGRAAGVAASEPGSTGRVGGGRRRGFHAPHAARRARARAEEVGRGWVG